MSQLEFLQLQFIHMNGCYAITIQESAAHLEYFVEEAHVELGVLKTLTLTTSSVLNFSMILSNLHAAWPRGTHPRQTPRGGRGSGDAGSSVG